MPYLTEEDLTLKFDFTVYREKRYVTLFDIIILTNGSCERSTYTV